MRADRLLSVVLSLQVKERVTARELAEQLEVSERTIYRDMDALSSVGIPVVSERGIHGGWRLLDGYRANLSALNLTEIQALFLSQPDTLLADLGLQQAARAALLKLLASLPALYRPHAEAMRQRLYVDLSGWNRSKEEVSWLPVVQETLWNDRKLNLVYQRHDGKAVERVVDPLGLVAKGNVWYLVAGIDDEIRTYRVSRIQSATVIDKPSARPHNFDLAAYWAQSTSDFFAALPRYAAVVRASPDILPRLRYSGTFAKLEQIDPPDADGWSQVRLHFDTEEEAREYVLGFGTHMEVIEPPELRDRVIEMAKAIIAFYANKAGR